MTSDFNGWFHSGPAPQRWQSEIAADPTCPLELTGAATTARTWRVIINGSPASTWAMHDDRWALASAIEAVIITSEATILKSQTRRVIFFFGHNISPTMDHSPAEPSTEGS